MKKLAIIATHPVQYNAPWFRMLAERNKIAIKVFYTWSQVASEKKFDPGFGRNIEWDIPLLIGYDYTFVENISLSPSSKSFKGIENPTLIEEVEDWQPDAVLVFGWKFKSHLRAIKHFKGKIPVLFRGDSTRMDNHPRWKQVVRRMILRRVFANIDIALYTGSQNKKYFEWAELNETQLIFAPHAVDNKRFAAHEENTTDNHEPSDRVVTFLFAGKLEFKKDPRLLLQAYNELSSPAGLIIVGNGSLEEELKNDFNGKKEVTFLDFQNQSSMPAIYHQADVFVMPSRGPAETWGLAVNEAMACDRPVLVSSKCGCAVDLVEDGKNGYIFRSGDKKDLKRKMELLIRQKDKLKQMGAFSAQKIRDWSFDKIVEAVERVVIGKE